MTGDTASSAVRDWATLALILLVGVGLRIAHWHPGFASDDSRYMNYAGLLASGGRLDVVDNAATRFVFESFLAIGMRLFGISTEVAAAMGLLVFVANGTLLYLLTVRLDHAKAGLLAAGLFAVLPLDIVYSTTVLPDGLMTAFCLASSLVYLRALAAGAGLRQGGGLFAAGILLGCAISTKETAFCLGIVFAIHQLTVFGRGGWPRRIARLALIASGAVVLMGLETAGLWIWTGDPLYRLHTLSHAFGEGGLWNAGFSAYDAATYVIVSLDTQNLFGVHALIVAIALLLAARDRHRLLTFPWIFLAVFSIYLSAGSTTLTRYVMVPQQPRYFLPVLAVGMVAAAMELRWLQARLSLPRVSLLGLALMTCSVSMWSAKGASVPLVNRAADWIGQLSPSERSNLVVSGSFLRRQALQRLAGLAGVDTLNLEGDGGSLADLAETLGERALLSSILSWDAGATSLGNYLETEGAPSYRQEEIRGRSWPPYKLWMGVGSQTETIGVVWRPTATGKNLPGEGR